MTGNLTDAAESRVVNWLTGNTTTAPTLPLKLRLMTVVGSDSAAGTEVTGGGYTPQTVAIGASSGGGAAVTSGDAVFTGMPAVGGSGVVAWEIWDSAGTPFRWWWGTVTGKTVNAGDDYKVNAGDLSLAAD